MAKTPRKTEGDHTYLWKGIPRPLWHKAQIKAKAERPPMDIKYVLEELLSDWVKGKRAVDPPNKKTARALPQEPAPINGQWAQPALKSPVSAAVDTAKTELHGELDRTERHIGKVKTAIQKLNALEGVDLGDSF